MKRTTYILIGMLLAGLVVMVGTIFYISTQGDSKEDNYYEIGGEQKCVQLPTCKSVLFALNEGDDVASVSFAGFPLLICPTDSAVGALSFAADLEKYITLRMENDVLWVELRFPKKDIKSPYDKQQWLFLRSAVMQLNIPVSVQRVGGNMADLRTTFRGFRRDTLSIGINGNACLEDCRIASLHASSRDLYLKSGELRNLYLNLDDSPSWNVNTDSFYIDTEHLTGSGLHHCKLSKGECREVFWTPLNKEASLEIKLNQAAKIEVDTLN